MGFYGNISNAGKTQISFDRIYANRKQMEKFCSSDNVFIGRKILIEYDDNTYPRRQGYIKPEDVNKDGLVQLYLDTELINPYREAEAILDLGIDKNITGYGFKEYDIVMVHYEDYYYYYVCEKFDEEGIAQFSLVKAGSEKQTDYTINYLIDKQWATNNGIIFTNNGWDSTIWEKAFIDNEFKYINIADLNSKVPRFDIRPYAPSEVPKAPDYDEIGTNLDYYLNQQATWGFRVKPAEEGGLSDVKTTIDGKQCDADIYFNAQALENNDEDIKIRTLAPTNMENIIELENAQSGNTYYINDNSNTKTKQNDIKQLKIHLPGIGDAVAKLWDLMYSEYDEEGKLKENRNTYIGWEESEENPPARMVYLDESGYEYTFNPDNTKSVAGCINSIHDLMGRIIDTKETTLSGANAEHIYYGKYGESDRKGFYIKSRKCTYTPLAPEDFNEYIKEKKYFDLTQYTPGVYHIISKGNYYVENDSKPIENTIHYLLSPKPVHLNTWIQDKDTEIKVGIPSYHYYKDNDSNYIKDAGELPNPDISYVTITSNQETKTELGKARTLIFKPVGREEIENENGQITYNGYIYFKVKDYDENGNPLTYDDAAQELKEGDELIEDALYYYVNGYYFEFVTVEGENDENEAKAGLINPENNTPYNSNNLPSAKNKINFIPFIENTYYYLDQNRNYILLKSLDDVEIDVVYYSLNVVPETGELKINPDDEESIETIYTHYYLADTYYYKQNANDYFFGIEKEMISEVKYFIIEEEQAVPQDIVFYKPNTYYYEKKTSDDKTVQVLDQDTTMKTFETELPNGETILFKKDGEDKYVYFQKRKAYVISDLSGNLSKGSIWNSGSDVPETIKLGKLYEGEDVDEDGNEVEAGSITLQEKAERMYEWKELTDFARELNTIHGLILKVNQYFKFDDTLTRDRDTIQGCLNNLNDLINDFATLIPGEITIVDEYGRLASARYETDNWIDLQVDNDVIDHKITITHSDPAPLQDPLEKNDLTLFFGDSFTVSEWAFDDKGHKTDSITHEIKIPNWNLEDAEHNNADIITNLSFTPTSGKLKTTRKNIVDLVLTNYELGNNSSNIVDTDTIGQAFGKTQNKINEIAAWISDEDTGAAKMKADINIINEKLTDEKITKWDQAEQNVQSDWLVEDESADNFIKNKPDLTNLVKTDTQFNYTFGDITTQMTIEGLLNYIASLEARIYNLENPIEEEVPPVE